MRVPCMAAFAAAALIGLASAAPAAADVMALLSDGRMFEVMAPAGGPAAGEKPVVLFLSGDAGWRRSLGRRAVAPLIADGRMVVGLDSALFFTAERSPADTARWIAAAAMRPGVPRDARLVLVGQSFGADALAAAAPLLPPDLARRVAGVGLIVPGQTRFDKVSLTEFLGLTKGVDNRAAAAQTAARWPLLCLQGADEPDSLCPALRGREVTRAALPGGHMLERDADALGGALLRWVRALPPS